jgi:hypothetical protein
MIPEVNALWLGRAERFDLGAFDRAVAMVPQGWMSQACPYLRRGVGQREPKEAAVSTMMRSPDGRPATGTPSQFLVLWQHSETRTFHRIGLLERSELGYRFGYEPQVRQVAGFEPLLNFPDIDRLYESADLFPVFANRVMTTRRDGYADYVSALGLGPSPEPFEVLARTLGARATDRIQVLPLPDASLDGRLQLVFLVHGIRHVDPTGLRVAGLHAGDPLFVTAEDHNPVNPLAVLVSDRPAASRDTSLGYVPDALTTLVRRLIAESTELDLRVERLNPEEGLLPDSMRVLARLEARMDADFDVVLAAGS